MISDLVFRNILSLNQSHNCKLVSVLRMEKYTEGHALPEILAPSSQYLSYITLKRVIALLERVIKDFALDKTNRRVGVFHTCI